MYGQEWLFLPDSCTVCLLKRIWTPQTYFEEKVDSRQSKRQNSRFENRKSIDEKIMAPLERQLNAFSGGVIEIWNEQILDAHTGTSILLLFLMTKVGRSTVMRSKKRLLTFFSTFSYLGWYLQVARRCRFWVTRGSKVLVILQVRSR